MNHKIALWFLCIILLSSSPACSPNPEQLNIRRTEAAGTIYAGQTAGSTLAQPTLKPPTSTRVPSPTPTQEPTLTPGPVPSGFRVPWPRESITSNNFSQITGLARWGSGAINQVAVSQDGNNIAIASSQGVDIYEDGGLTPLYHWASGYPVSGVTVSNQADLVAYTLQELTIINSLSNGTQVTEFPHYSDPSRTRLLLSPDGSFLATWEGQIPGQFGGGDNRLCFTKLDTGESGCKVLDEEPVAVQFSPLSQYVAAVGGFGDGIYIWELSGWELVNKINGVYRDNLIGLFSPDDQLFVNDFSNDIKIINLSNGMPVLEMQDSPLLAYNRAFSPDGKILILGGEAWDVDGGLLLLWDLENDKSYQYNLPEDVISVSFSQDGRYVGSGTRDGEVQVWEFNGQTLRQKSVFTHAGVETVFFGNGGNNLVSISSDQVVKIWDTESGALLKTIGDIGFTGAFSAVSISSSLKYVAASSASGEIIVWLAENGEVVFTLGDPTGSLLLESSQIGFSHDGKFLISLDREYIRQWSLDNGKLKTKFNLTGDKENYLGPHYIFLDESYHFIGPEYTASLWDTQDELVIVVNKWTRELLRRCIPDPAWQIKHDTILQRATDLIDLTQFACLTSDARNVLVSPDGASLYTLNSTGDKACTRDTYAAINNICLLIEETPSVSEEETHIIEAWNVADGSLKREIQFPEDRETHLFSWSISPDGKYLALVMAEGIAILDVESGETIQRIELPSTQSEYPWVTLLPPFFSLDSTLLFTATGNDIIVWQTSTGQLVRTLSGHAGEVTGLTLSGDGALLVTASKDGTIRLWGIP